MYPEAALLARLARIEGRIVVLEAMQLRLEGRVKALLTYRKRPLEEAEAREQWLAGKDGGQD